MSTGLRKQSLARVDQHDGQIGSGRAGDHVACALLIARRVGDDKSATRGRKRAIRNVDRDPFVRLGGALEGSELVVEDRLGLVQQPAEERTFAVVYAAANNEPQERRAIARLQVFHAVRRNESGQGFDSIAKAICTCGERNSSFVLQRFGMPSL